MWLEARVVHRFKGFALDVAVASVRPGGVHVPPEARRVGLVLQDALLFPNRTVRGNLAYAPGA
ncbi:MAG TPA: hypothetical protein VNE71_15610, partial [Myxococcota bacterium]|nr:hypothetical protein [Myxococcota bacterium]